jgi:hypothetical protein
LRCWQEQSPSLEQICRDILQAPQHQLQHRMAQEALEERQTREYCANVAVGCMSLDRLEVGSIKRYFVGYLSIWRQSWVLCEMRVLGGIISEARAPGTVVSMAVVWFCPCNGQYTQYTQNPFLSYCMTLLVQEPSQCRPSRSFDLDTRWSWLLRRTCLTFNLSAVDSSMVRSFSIFDPDAGAVVRSMVVRC